MRFETELGTVGIANSAIAAVAADCARSCFGVRAVGRGGVIAQLLGRAQGPGVVIHPQPEGGVRVELHIAVGYGVNLPAVCRSIISEMRYAVRQRTGVDVCGVDIYIDALRP